MEVGHWLPEGASKLTKGYQTANAMKVCSGVRLYEISRTAKREKPRPTVKAPKCALSGKGCRISRTARTLAQKQPFV